MANADIELLDNINKVLPAEMSNKKTFVAISRYDINYQNQSINLRETHIGHKTHGALKQAI